MLDDWGPEVQVQIPDGVRGGQKFLVNFDGVQYAERAWLLARNIVILLRSSVKVLIRACRSRFLTCRSELDESIKTEFRKFIYV